MVPFVSVIVPVFNDESSVATLVDCLAAQDQPREWLEIVVCDNASTDLTAELASRLEAFMTRARDDLSLRHAAVDTDREYEMLARTCGATPDLVR